MTRFMIAFVLNTWQTLEPGTHKFPFALKVNSIIFYYIDDDSYPTS